MMTNDFHRETCLKIKTMSLAEVQGFIERVEYSRANAWAGSDDKAGDIAESTWLSLAQERLRELTR